MKGKTKVKNAFKIIIYSLFLLCIIVVSLVALYIFNTVQSVKNLNLGLSQNNNVLSTIYDATGNVDDVNVPKSNYYPIDKVNKDTINAFISIEDKEFYNHKGLNYKRIAKATLNNIKSMSFKEGASTITQQLVKNRYLSNEKTIDRKIKEAYLSIKLEKQEDKDKILECYLNTIYFGHGAYGIEEAAKVYFDKEPGALSLSESCVLAGVIKAPSLYSPINNYENSLNRRNLILKEMYEDNMITKEEYDKSVGEDILLSINEYEMNSGMSLYDEYVIDECMDILKINRNQVLYGGYKIYTYKDNTIQEVLDTVIANEDNYHTNTYGNTPDSLSMVINNNDYSVSAIAGKSKYNLVNIKRQPGSLIKPIFTYAPALEEKEVYLCSQILDEEINVDGYSPKNVGGTYSGYISVRDAISKSLNIPAIKLTQTLGIDKCKRYAESAGISFSDDDIGYALALGGMTNGVTLKEITDSYSTFTGRGAYTKSAFVERILDSNNHIVYNRKLSSSNVFHADTSYLMTESLMYATKNGTSKKLQNLPFQVAGKTGTVAVKDTNLNTDAYSLAYTTEHTMSVWLGNYTMNKEYHLEGSNNGGTFATKIILDTFNEIYKNFPPPDFEVPKDIVECNIDNKSLIEDHIVVMGEHIPDRYKIKEIFSRNNMPKSSSEKYNKISPFDISVDSLKNSVRISFSANDYTRYKIYRKCDGKKDVIKEITGADGEYVFIDIDVKPNKLYSYYVEASNVYADKTYITNEKNIKIIKEYNKLLEDENTQSYDWLFA